MSLTSNHVSAGTLCKGSWPISWLSRNRPCSTHHPALSSRFSSDCPAAIYFGDMPISLVSLGIRPRSGSRKLDDDRAAPSTHQLTLKSPLLPVPCSTVTHTLTLTLHLHTSFLHSFVCHICARYLTLVYGRNLKKLPHHLFRCSRLLPLLPSSH